MPSDLTQSIRPYKIRHLFSLVQDGTAGKNTLKLRVLIKRNFKSDLF